jgi:photosystem II stability/assembly factor-like uncharacterized protein
MTGDGEKTGAWLAVRLFPDHHGWALTVRGVLHSRDDGQHWHDVTPWTANDYQFGGRTDVLSDFLNGNEAWLVLPGRTAYVKVGQDQKPEQARSFRTRDGGKTWKEGEIPDTASTYDDTQSGAGFVGGMLKPADPQGENRHQVSINDISATSGQNAWITVSKSYTHTGGGHEDIVFVYSRVWHSNDGGKSWKLLVEEKPSGSGSSTMSGGWISLVDATTGFMAGSTPFSLRVSHDGGATWQTQELPTPSLKPLDLQSAMQGQATFFDMRNGVIPVQVYYASEQHFQVFQYVTHDGAKTWQMSMMEGSGRYEGAFYLDAQHWILIQGSTTLLKTEDGGKTWRTVEARTGFAYISDVTFVSNQQYWALGRNVEYLEGNHYSQDDATAVLKTMDGGKTWVKVRYTIE